MTPAAQAKLQEAQRLSAEFERIFALPQQEFADIQRPRSPQPPPIDAAALHRAHRAIHLRGVRFWDREGRRRAIAEADAAATAEQAALLREYAARPAQWQAELDRGWEALRANDPDVVLSTLAAAFEDNEAPAAAIGVDGDEVSLAVLVPVPEDALPERKPGVTPAGNVSLKKLTKREASEVYTHVVCGHVLATVKECFAVAPGARSARVIAVRPGSRDSYGRVRPEAVLATNIERHRLQGIRWNTADATSILEDCHSELHWKQKGAAKELHALDLRDHPKLAEALDAITFEEGTS